MALVRLYGDIGGGSRDEVMIAGCYIGSRMEWNRFDRDWRAALNEARADHFHATEWAGRHPPYAWLRNDDAKYAELSDRFASLPRAHNLYGFAYGIAAKVWHETIQPEMKKIRNKKRPYSARAFCYEGLFTNIANWIDSSPVRLLPTNERIGIVLEVEHGIGDIVDYFNYAKKRGEPWTRHFQNVTPGEKKELRELQAADMIAYEARREIIDLTANPNAPTRPMWKRMLEGERAAVIMMRADDAKASVDKVREFLREAPDGLAVTFNRRQRLKSASDLSASSAEPPPTSEPE